MASKFEQKKKKEYKILKYDNDDKTIETANKMVDIFKDDKFISCH